jgi:hypothetical protein
MPESPGGGILLSENYFGRRDRFQPMRNGGVTFAKLKPAPFFPAGIHALNNL